MDPEYLKAVLILLFSGCGFAFPMQIRIQKRSMASVKWEYIWDFCIHRAFTLLVEELKVPKHEKFSVFRICIDLNTDPDPAFEVNTDPDPDHGFFVTKIKENFDFFSVTNCHTYFDWGLSGSSKTHQAFSKPFQYGSTWIWIRIQIWIRNTENVSQGSWNLKTLLGEFYDVPYCTYN